MSATLALLALLMAGSLLLALLALLRSQRIVARKHQRMLSAEHLAHQQQTLRALNDIAALPALELRELLVLALDIGCQHLRLPLGVLSRADEQTLTVTSFAGPEGALHEGDQFPLADTFCDTTLALHDVYVVEDANAEGLGDHRACHVFGTQAYIGVPVQVHGSTYGTLCFAQQTPLAGHFADTDREFMRLFARWLGVTLEKHEHARAQAELIERLEHAQRIARLGHWHADLSTGELTWSPMVYEIFGLDPQQVRPTIEIFKQLVHPDDQLRVQASEKRAQLTGRHDVVHRIIRPDGDVRWVHELATLAPDTQGLATRLIGTVQDISERKHIERLQDEFVSTVSHELRTPLTAINGALGIVCAEVLAPLPDSVRPLLQTAYANGQRLTALIDDLLDMEKLSTGQIRLRPEAVDLGALLVHCVERTEPYAHQYQVGLSLSPVPAVSLLTDAHRLEQVLANLLSNAAKFSPAGSTVTLRALPSPDSLRIEVEDQGPGIPDDFKPFVFGKFRQADSSDTRHHEGTGLGLAISQAIVEQLGGQIGFHNLPSRGCVFWVELPWQLNPPSEKPGFRQPPPADSVPDAGDGHQAA